MSRTWSKTAKLMAALLFIALVSIGTYIGYLWLTYIDKDVESGQAYGLIIGENKDQVLEKISATFDQIGFKSDQVFVEVAADAAMANELGIAENRHVMIHANPSDYGLSKGYAKDQWVFYNKKNHHDFLRLNFCDEKLCRIYRHRKNFELP